MAFRYEYLTFTKISALFSAVKRGDFQYVKGVTGLIFPRFCSEHKKVQTCFLHMQNNTF